MRHNVRMLRLVLLCLLFLAAPPASAWNAGGHRIVALIAWQQMTPTARDAAVQLLASHPDYRLWLTRPGAVDAGLQAFLEASTWPDDIRGDARFFDEGRETPTPAQPGHVDLRRHRDWHYLDNGDQSRSRTGELDHQLARLATVLANPQHSVGERSYALPWLLHLVADAHQPLHVGKHHDEGGNLFAIEDPGHPRLPHSNLHRWWDDLPGPPWLRGERLRRTSERLLRENEPPRQGDIALWLVESRRLCSDFAYPASPRITPEFRHSAQAIADRRLVEAGWRLGRWLNALFAEVSRETAKQ